MDEKELGGRIRRARERVDRSQSSLGDALGLDRSAISLVEQGQRNVRVTELLKIADLLERPLSYFVAPDVPAVVSRRQALPDTHESTALLDDELRMFSSDVAALLAQGVLTGRDRNDVALRTPHDHDEAERTAQDVRNRGGIQGAEPVDDLGSFAETFGMLTFAADLSPNGPDGACVEVGPTEQQLGAAVINGRAPAGRRRMTLAHELGHWLFGDAYDHAASRDAERMIDSFAIHLLVPRAGVTELWNGRQGAPAREVALRVGSTFRVSWSAAVGQLRNLGFISYEEHLRLIASPPATGEFSRLRLTIREDKRCPYLSPAFLSSVLSAFAQERLTRERALELLRGTLGPDDLPPLDDPQREDLEASFFGHE